MHQQQLSGRKVHVTDIAQFFDVTVRHAFRIQADIKKAYNLSEEEKITLHLFAMHVKLQPDEVLRHLAVRKQ